jgi:nicotinamidase-related amidase
MARKTKSGAGDFHAGKKPEQRPTVLLVVDVINDFAFPEAEQLLGHALPMAKNLSRLCAKARKNNVPVIYVNDNFGRWQSDFKSVVAYCLKGAGSRFVRKLVPRKRDYFVLKPKHSGFYSTTLEVLLEHLGAKKVVVTGVATDICVFFTANDAYMRDLKISVPRDCVAANTTAASTSALRAMEKLFKADIRASDRIVF